MQKIACEMCGCNDLLKQDGIFVCQSCGMKYAAEEIKKMMVEGTVDVQGTVKVDNTAFVQKYLANARRAKSKEDWLETEKYYNLVEQNDPTNIEAIFYSTFARVKTALLEAETSDKRQGVFNVLVKSVSIIDDNYDNANEEHQKLLFEIVDDIKGLKTSRIVPTTHLQEYVTKNGYGNIVDRNQVVENDPLSVTYAMIDMVMDAYEESFANIAVVQCESLTKEEIREKAYDTLMNGYSMFAFHYFKEYTKKNTDSPVGYLGKAVALLTLNNYGASAEEVAVASKYTVNESNKEDVKRLIEMTGSSCNRTLLVNAAAFANYEAVKFLVEVGSDVNFRANEDKTALWHVAADNKFEEADQRNARKCVKVLLDAGADASVTTTAGVATFNNKTDPEIASMIQAKFPNLEKGKSSGCYVATAVYGSYDCPQVWTLRRFRDFTLAKTWYGRAFIRTYYAISPTLVKWFGETNWFKKMWQGKLDRMVKKLQSQGVESTPYTDINW
ncbi:MAG: ankyrin repeat domain-containing protein [Clostridia bacterium]|nr:ankyrin repeat domain-containing protein [Clostridia bacterium]